MTSGARGRLLTGMRRVVARKVTDGSPELPRLKTRDQSAHRHVVEAVLAHDEVVALHEQRLEVQVELLGGSPKAETDIRYTLGDRSSDRCMRGATC